MSSYVTLWVIEMRAKHGKVWRPTADAFLDREIARGRLPAWKHANPDDAYRVRPYQRAEPHSAGNGRDDGN